jgi:acyl carrier protein
MSKLTVEQVIKELVETVLPDAFNDLNMNEPYVFQEDDIIFGLDSKYGFDSIDYVILFNALDKRYGIQVGFFYKIKSYIKLDVKGIAEVIVKESNK